VFTAVVTDRVLERALFTAKIFLGRIPNDGFENKHIITIN